jgi:1,2-diacylglycerol 3-alpha-glucosyltransferase
MKIAYLTQSYPPMVSGASLVSKSLAKSMAGRGHEVLVITASDRGEGYTAIKSNLTLLRLRSLHNPMRVGQRFLLYPRRAILRSLHEFQPDLVHSHEPLQMGLLGLAYARRAKVPVLLSVHQLPWFVGAYLPEKCGIRRVAEAALWAYGRWSLRQYTSLVTPTRTISRIISEMTGIDSQVISYGIDLQTFHPRHSSDEETATRSRLNLPPGVPVIVHVGRLDTEKRVERVIVAATLAMQKSDAHLLVVGDGRQKTVLMKLCKSLGIEKRCHFPGYVSAQEGLPEIYRLASIFVTASEIETQGIVLLEAAASGLPIVAVRATCIPEIVHDRENGCLVAPSETLALGEAITNLLMDPDKARQMGQAGRESAMAHNILSTFDSYERSYADSIKGKASQLSTEKVKVLSWQERAKEWLNL